MMRTLDIHVLGTVACILLASIWQALAAGREKRNAEHLSIWKLGRAFLGGLFAYGVENSNASAAAVGIWWFGSACTVTIGTIDIRGVHILYSTVRC